MLLWQHFNYFINKCLKAYINFSSPCWGDWWWNIPDKFILLVWTNMSDKELPETASSALKYALVWWSELFSCCGLPQDAECIAQSIMETNTSGLCDVIRRASRQSHTFMSHKSGTYYTQPFTFNTSLTASKMIVWGLTLKKKMIQEMLTPPIHCEAFRVINCRLLCSEEKHHRIPQMPSA